MVDEEEAGVQVGFGVRFGVAVAEVSSGDDGD